MNRDTSTFFPALADSALGSKPPVSAPSPLPKLIPKPASSSNITGPACPTLETSGASSPCSGASAPNAPLNCDDSLRKLSSLRAACLASLRAHSDKCAALLTNAGSGPNSSDWSARYERCAPRVPRSTPSLRTRQASLPLMADEPGTELCQRWSRAGLICGGMYFPLPPLVQDICASASSSSLPTPTTGMIGSDVAVQGITDQRNKPNKLGQVIGRTLLPTPRASANESRQTKLTPSQAQGTPVRSLCAEVAQFLATPTARDWKDTPGMTRLTDSGRNRDDQLPRQIYGAECFQQQPENSLGGMRLTPEFQCWLMGYPPDWLKPLRAALETPSSRKSRSSSAKPSGSN